MARVALAVLLFVCHLAGAEGLAALDDLLAALPAPAKPRTAAATALGELNAVAPGILAGSGRVVLEGATLFDQGPVDGLEVLACLDGGKTHESMIRLATGNGQLVKFAVISILGVDDGVGSPESSGLPARGTPLRLTAQWPAPDGAGEWVEADASCLVRDRRIDRPYPPLPWIYTGSRMQVTQEAGPDGVVARRERFMLDSTKSVMVNFDEADALIASPFPGADSDARFEVYTGIAPPPGTPIRLVISAVDLPLTLRAHGEALVADAEGVAGLDDDALVALLRERFAAAAKPVVAAVGVRVDPLQPRERDVAMRARIIAAAGRAGVWVVPVFVLAR
ncbi:MAG: hypothetical protein H0W72_10985 [Planctomycetes bacterium]|nr:hypothetical protein [Planctomycetota bacterium]